MTRYFIELSYNGRDFHGWQKQPNGISVQELIEDAITRLHSNTLYPVTGCGRTDTGVHAKFYVLHVDLPTVENCELFIFKLNRMLPQSIALHTMYECDKHARFDANSRIYRYFIHSTKDPFLFEQSWYFPQKLDFNKMNDAAQLLIGKKDFTSLSKLHTDVKTNICNVRSASWVVLNEKQAFFEIEADRFLRNMVRATVGTLIEVGLGKLDRNAISAILAAKDRSAAATSAPAEGLFLWDIKY